MCPEKKEFSKTTTTTALYSELVMFYRLLFGDEQFLGPSGRGEGGGKRAPGGERIKRNSLGRCAPLAVIAFYFICYIYTVHHSNLTLDKSLNVY